jgi:hypothetical protein
MTPVILRSRGSSVWVVALTLMLFGSNSATQAQDTPDPACATVPKCVPTGDCSPSHDDRECNRCLVSAFGHCAVRGNDPACEAAKAAQNGIYAAQKAQCETAKEQDRLTCETYKAKLIATFHCPAPPT